MERFHEMLETFESVDNDARRRAEEEYKQMQEANIGEVIALLVQCARQGLTENVKMTAGVLLRRTLLMGNDDAWHAIGREGHDFLRNQLVEAFQEEGSTRVRRLLSHVIAQVAVLSMSDPLPEEKTGRPELPAEGWEDVIPLALAGAATEDDNARASSYHLLSVLCECLADKMHTFSDDVEEAIRSGLSASQPIEVSRNAVSAGANYCYHLVDAERRERLSVLVGPMMDVIVRMLETGHYATPETLSDILSMGTEHPDMFRGTLTSVAALARDVGAAMEVDETVRRLAVELAVSLAEAAPASARREEGFVETIVPALLNLATIIEQDDDEEWCAGQFSAEGDSSGDDETFAISMVAEGGLLRVAAAVGGARVLPLAIPEIERMGSAAEWTCRRAAMVGLTMLCQALGDRSGTLSADVRAGIVEMALEHADAKVEGHPRVRHAALGCLGAMAGAFDDARGVHFQEETAERVLPCLAEAAGSEENPPRVCAQAAEAISIFCAPSRCSEEVTGPFAEMLLGALARLMDCSMPTVVASALKAIAAVAQSSGEAFEGYYEDFMGALHKILSTLPKARSAEQHRAFRALRTAAIECIGLLAEAVGRETFAKDAESVLGFLLADGLDEDEDSFTAGAVQEATARIAGVMGADFEPYLRSIMPQLLKAAEQEAEVWMDDADESGEARGRPEGVSADDVSSITMQVRGMSTSVRMNMNTTAIEAKTTALRALFEYAGALGGSFADWIDAVTRTMLFHVSYPYLPTIRGVASLGLPRLLACAFQAGDERLAARIFGATVAAISAQLAQERDVETRASLAEGLKESLRIALSGASEDDYVQESRPVLAPEPRERLELLETLSQTAQESVERREAVIARLREAGEADEEAIANLEESFEDEVDLMTNVIDAVGYLIKGARGDLLPDLERTFLRVVAPLLESDQPKLIHNALCTMVDVAEWCGPAASRHAAELVEFLDHFAQSDDEELRQVAVYGLGAIAQSHPQVLRSVPNGPRGVVQRLVEVVEDDSAKDEENLFATENAISSIAKVCRHAYPSAAATGGAPELAQFWAKWIENLPLREDPIEARYCHRTLVEELNNGTFQGPVPLAHAARVMAEVIVGVAGGGADEDALATEDVVQEMARLLPTVIQEAGPDNVHECAKQAGLGDAEMGLLAENA